MGKRITVGPKYLMIVVFMVLTLNCLYMVDTEKIHITGSFAYSDIWFVLLIIYDIYLIYIYRKQKSKFAFKWEILALVVMVFIAALQANNLTGQSFAMGLRPQRHYLLILLSYFPVRKLFSAQENQIPNLFMVLFKLGVVIAALCVLQKLVIEKFQFMYFMISKRNDTWRFYVDCTLIQVTALIAAYKFASEKNKRYLLALALCVLYEFWISQGRLEIMAVLSASLIAFLYASRLDSRKIFWILALCGIIFIFLMSRFATDLWQAISVADTATSAQGNTMAIRYEGRALYNQQLNESALSFIFGCGYPNSLYEKAANLAGYDRHIGLNDNGIFGFRYIYGNLGTTVVLLLFLRLFIMSFMIYRRTRNTVPMTYVIMNVILSYNIIFWYWKSDGTWVFILMICYIETFMERLKRDRDNWRVAWI